MSELRPDKSGSNAGVGPGSGVETRATHFPDQEGKDGIARAVASCSEPQTRDDIFNKPIDQLEVFINHTMTNPESEYERSTTPTSVFEGDDCRV